MSTHPPITTAATTTNHHHHPTTSLSHLPPPNTITNATKIISVTNEILESIESVLRSSATTRDQFQKEWTRLQLSYAEDMDSIERELASLPPTYELLLKLKGKRGGGGNDDGEEEEDGGGCGLGRRYIDATTTTKNDADHALNFHLRQNKNDDDVVRYDNSNNNDDASSSSSSAKTSRRRCRSATTTTRKQKRTKVTTPEERFTSREILFQKLDEMKDVESQLERELSELSLPRSRDGDDGDNEKRYHLEKALEAQSRDN